MTSIDLATLLRQVRARLTEAGLDEPAADARTLIGGILNLSAASFLSDPERVVSEDERQSVDVAVQRRLNREPVFRILGRREFYGLDLRLSSGTLEPRPDTEILVDRVLPQLERIVAVKGQASIADFGTGTGAIALALLANCAQAEAIGIDISEDALETASRNAEALGLSSRFRTLKSSWTHDVDGSFDLVVSNPPYIASQVMSELSPEVLLHDPPAALDGGADGLDAYRALAAGLPGCLSSDGVVGLEIGFDQKQSVSDIFIAAGFDLIEAAKDYGGNDRVLLFARSP